MKMEAKIPRTARTRASSGNRRGKAPAGFTLTELLVAMLVLAIGGMAVLHMQASGMNAGDRATSLAVATFLAESQAEWIQTMEVSKVQFVSEDPERLLWDGTACSDTTPDSQCFTRTTHTVCFSPTTRSCEVSVAVKWLAADGWHSMSYDTVVSDYGF